MQSVRWFELVSCVDNSPQKKRKNKQRKTGKDGNKEKG
jgi:hypothetical protein